MKRAEQRSWTSSDKDQVTQPHHPNQPHCCWRSRTCSAISPPAQLTSYGTRKKKTKKQEADSPGLQECDTVGQLISAITELPVLPAAHGEVGNLLQQQGTAEQDRAVLSHSPACWQDADTAISREIFILLPGKAFSNPPSQNTDSSSSVDFQRQKDNSSQVFANMQNSYQLANHRIPEWFCRKGP